jgi:hypothetical protein
MPVADGHRKLIRHDIVKREALLLADLLSGKDDLVPTGDICCDFHPRWNRDGSAMPFDSMREEQRHVHAMDMRDAG